MELRIAEQEPPAGPRGVRVEQLALCVVCKLVQRRRCVGIALQRDPEKPPRSSMPVCNGGYRQVCTAAQME